MEKQKEINEIPPTEGKRDRTSLNLQQTQVEELTKISEVQKITITAIFDEAIADYLAKKRNTEDIDQMLKQTGGFWFERSLETVKTLLPKQKIEKLLPYAKAYLYFNLKDNADRERVFDALALNEELKEINAVNLILGKASIYNGDALKSYNSHIIANELRAKLTPLQQDYLSLKIGKDAFAKLKERRPEMFPEPKIFDGETVESFDEKNMNPALPTVLQISGLTKEGWESIACSEKKQIHDAVRDGKTDLAKQLAKTALELVPLFL